MEQPKCFILNVFVTIFTTLEGGVKAVDSNHGVFRLDLLMMLTEEFARAKVAEIADSFKIPMDNSLLDKVMAIALHFSDGLPSVEPFVTLFITVDNGSISQISCDLDRPAGQGKEVVDGDDDDGADDDDGGDDKDAECAAMDVDDDGKKDEKKEG